MCDGKNYKFYYHRHYSRERMMAVIYRWQIKKLLRCSALNFFPLCVSLSTPSKINNKLNIFVKFNDSFFIADFVNYNEKSIEKSRRVELFCVQRGWKNSDFPPFSMFNNHFSLRMQIAEGWNWVELGSRDLIMAKNISSLSTHGVHCEKWQLTARVFRWTTWKQWTTIAVDESTMSFHEAFRKK